MQLNAMFAVNLSTEKNHTKKNSTAPYVVKNVANKCRFPECFLFREKKHVCGNCYPGYLLLRPFPHRTYERYHEKLEKYMRVHFFNEQEKQVEDLIKSQGGFFHTEHQVPSLSLKSKVADQLARGFCYYTGMRDGAELDREFIEKLSKKQKVKVEDIHSVVDEYIQVPYRYTTEDYNLEKFNINPVDAAEAKQGGEPEMFDLKVKIYHCNSIDPDNLQPVLLWMHGGGFVFGDVEDAVTHRLAIRLAKYINGIVVNINYRLAPEFKWPTQHEDCFSVLKWVYENGRERLGADVNRIIVGGDSAGGNIATVLCIMAKERGGPRILHQFCIYPGVHAEDTESESFRKYKKGPLLRLSLLLWFKSQFLLNPNSNVTDHPFISPLVYDNVLGLPPLTMITAGYCPLTDHARLYAEKLKKAGVPVSYTEYSNCFHGFFTTFSDDSTSAIMEGCIAFNIQYHLARNLASSYQHSEIIEEIIEL